MSHAQTSPSSAVERAAVAFLTPRAPKERRDLMLEGGYTSALKTPEGGISFQSAGSGPAVLLLHGWEGQASDLEAFAHPLLEAGFQVVAMDLPAHGRSEGRQTNIPQSARALIAAGKVLGPMQAVIAHSIGSAMLAEALHAGLEVQRAVMIAAPAHYGQHMRAFAAASGLEGLGPRGWWISSALRSARISTAFRSPCARRVFANPRCSFIPPMTRLCASRRAWKVPPPGLVPVMSGSKGLVTVGSSRIRPSFQWLSRS